MKEKRDADINRELTLYTEGVFNAAHRIEGHRGQCSTWHGHTWKICLWIKGRAADRDKEGIIWDFGNMKTIIETLDHKNLNEVLGFNPTAENLTLYTYRQVKEKDPHLNFKVRVYESLVSKLAYCEAGDF